MCARQPEKTESRCCLHAVFMYHSFPDSAVAHQRAPLLLARYFATSTLLSSTSTSTFVAWLWVAAPPSCAIASALYFAFTSSDQDHRDQRQGDRGGGGYNDGSRQGGSGSCCEQLHIGGTRC